MAANGRYGCDWVKQRNDCSYVLTLIPYSETGFEWPSIRSVYALHAKVENSSVSVGSLNQLNYFLCPSPQRYIRG